MDFKDLPKAYEAGAVEADIYKKWEESGAFNPDKLADLDKRYADAEPYCIVLPPPNRTGTLHLGHAKMLAIEDLLIRFHRMRGYKTYWVPGTDHAALATQVKVEQLLVKEGFKEPRKELGREKFLEKVREFAQQSRDTIVNQCKAMGSSMDWTREKYTLDAERNKAVNTTFKMMYEDKLIEQDFRLVNWDPKFQTTLSDDEVEIKETHAKLYTFKYDKDFPIPISTTRPETKFGDIAVAVHPESKWKEFVGKRYRPIFCGVQLDIKIIADEAVDPDFGTGAVGITPAHSEIDAEIAERHKLKGVVDVIGKDGRISHPLAVDFLGLTVEEARKKIEGLLKDFELLEDVKEIPQNLPIAQRGGTPVEKIRMKQWFVRVNKKFKLRQNTLGKWKKGEEVTLKELMHYAVESQQTRVLPENFEKIYFHWIDNLRDWCISRQIWFGHQIPVWYKGEEIKVGSDSPGEGWERDPDTLDTWFSSGLWTFSTLGWPDNASVDAAGNLVKTGELKEYHPTAVLETGYDILFFWVARMVLMSTYALGEVPFRDTYLHGLVRDDQGRKMSKSLGNVLDPLELIPKYGTDAVRLSLVMGTAPGMDQKLSEEKIKDFRNFTNKLWNISRYILITVGDKISEYSKLETKPLTDVDVWFLTRLNEVKESVTKKLENYEFSLAGEELRDFTWSDLADWYLESTKIQKNKEVILSHALKELLKLWHPFMPYVTAHIWRIANFEGDLIIASWPTYWTRPVMALENFPDQPRISIASNFGMVKEIITDFRRLRSENGVDPGSFIAGATGPSGDGESYLLVGPQGPGLTPLIKANEDIIKGLARLSEVRYENVPSGWPIAVFGTQTLGIDISGGIDLAKEKEKIQKEIDALKPYISSTEAKLQNTEFISKAPEKVVAEMRNKLEEAKAKLGALEKRVG